MSPLKRALSSGKNGRADSKRTRWRRSSANRVSASSPERLTPARLSVENNSSASSVSSFRLDDLGANIDYVPDYQYITETPYRIAEDEVVEDENLLVAGETISDATEDNVPVRVLTDFSIYEYYGRQLINAAELLDLDCKLEEDYVYGASGLVSSYVEDDNDDHDDDDDDDDSSRFGFHNLQRVKLSQILELNIHNISASSSGALQLDPKIYLRTKHAWYILDEPAKDFFPFYVEFWIQHRIFHLLISTSLQNANLDRNRFVKCLKVTPESPDSVASSLRYISRELTEHDLDADGVRAYIHTMLNYLCEDSAPLRKALARVPLIRSLRGTGEFAASTKRAARKSGPQKRLRDVEKDVLLHRNQTIVTPVVAGVARGLFVQTLRIAGQSLKEASFDDEIIDANEPARAHYTDPIKIKWINGSRTAPNHYQSVEIEGVTYSIGDIVIVEKGADSNTVRERNAATDPSRSSNWLANVKWFCQIAYMFEREEVSESKDGSKTVYRKYFHAIWLQHGSQMILQETAHSNGLYFLNECDDLPIECIFRLCDFKVLVPNELESEPESDAGTDAFFGWLTWDHHNTALTEIPELDKQAALDACKPWKRCSSCGMRKLRQKARVWQSLEGEHTGISRNGVDYHELDFVYLVPDSSLAKSSLYRIAQIVELKFHEKSGRIREVVVRHYERYDVVVRDFEVCGESGMITDDRRLIRLPTFDTIKPDLIEGKAFVTCSDSVRHRDKWLEYDDHFYLDCYATHTPLHSMKDIRPLMRPISVCEKCLHQRDACLQKEKHLLELKGPLRGLELFAGAGGLSTGMELSGFVKTKWAIEFSPSAALTYKANHPSALVFNQDTNVLLKHALAVYEGKNPRPLMSLRTDTPEELPPMPRKGEVDFIYGGPPCQSFSMMNHNKKADDIRNTLVCNMLSYVEFYRPLYFLLENVTGLLFYPLKGRQNGRSIIGGIKMGVVKFILRALISLGYQVQFKVLQAGQYGAPQGRRRVIFWGSKQGVPLPKFPLPKHDFRAGSQSYKLPTGDVLYPVTRSMVDETSDKTDYHQYAPLPPIRVNDAIGDLPSFDWCNPFKEIPASPEDWEEIGARANRGIRRFDAVRSSADHTYPGYTNPVRYAHAPMSRYQKHVRQGSSAKVSHHYTRRFGAKIVERVVQVPLRPGADHVDLPRKLRVHGFFESNGTPKYRGIYGRIDGQEFFQTALTTVGPNCKGGRLLHPNQKRILSVRECARAQGFPDTYEFLSVNNKLADRVADQHRQIGNAVPVPLALALGKELGKALIKYWNTQDSREESPEW